jgi:hypothetical protein
MASDTPLDDSMERVAEIASEYIRSHSPSGKIGASFRMAVRGATVRFVSRLIEARMTQTNGRHPLFGNRKHWYAENQRDPSRTDWADRLADEAADAAIDEAADVYVAGLTAEIR